MDLSTDMLTAFVRMAERLSVAAASQELGVAKSVVSKRVTQFEQGLGATLLARSTWRTSLQPAGRAPSPSWLGIAMARDRGGVLAVGLQRRRWRLAGL